MNHLTLTHSRYAYVTAVTVLLTIGSGSLAEKLAALSRPRWPIPIICIHLVILSAVVCVVSALGGVPGIMPRSGIAAIILVCVGIVIAMISLKADRLLLGTLLPNGSFRHPSSLSISAIALSSAIAILEEILFRGYLVHLGQSALNPVIVWLAVLSTLLAFAISHAYAGIEQAIAKMPLGMLTLSAVLCSKTLLPAIVAHVLFNVRSTDASILRVRR
jgi:membrane protease YdiL (CAAX protease family)